MRVGISRDQNTNIRNTGGNITKEDTEERNNERSPRSGNENVTLALTRFVWEIQWVTGRVVLIASFIILSVNLFARRSTTGLERCFIKGMTYGNSRIWLNSRQGVMLAYHSLPSRQMPVYWNRPRHPLQYFHVHPTLNNLCRYNSVVI